MSIRVIKYILFSFLFCFSQNLSAQCYQSVRQNGINLMSGKKPDFAQAINKFWAAYECPDKPTADDLSLQIKRAQGLWVQQLEGLVEEAKAAELIAKNSQKAEASARQEAEQNAKEARRKGILAEALRLSVLSSGAIQKGKKSDALELSFLAMLLGKEAPQLALQKAFFEAVRDSFTNVILADEKAKNLSSNEGGILVSDEKGFQFFSKNSPSIPLKIAQNSNENLFFKTNSKNGDWAIWSENSLRVFDKNGKLRATHSKHSESILEVNFSTNSKKTISASRDNSVVVTNLETGVSTKIEAHDGNVYEAEFSPDNQLILTRSSDGKIRIWNTDGSMKSELQNSSSYFYTAVFSPNSKRILTGSADGMPKIWGLDGKLIREFKTDFDAPIIETAFLENGKKIVAFAQNGRFGIWNSSGESVFKTPNDTRVSGFKILDDSSELLLWDNDFFIKKINSNGEILLEAKGHKTEIIHAEQSADKKYLLSSSEDGRTILWDADGNILTSWSLPAEKAQPAFFDAKGKVVVLSNSNTSEIQICPVPTLIADNFFKNKGEHLKRAHDLQTVYDIQFLEELMPKN